MKNSRPPRRRRIYTRKSESQKSPAAILAPGVGEDARGPAAVLDPGSAAADEARGPVPEGCPDLDGQNDDTGEAHAAHDGGSRARKKLRLLSAAGRLLRLA